MKRRTLWIIGIATTLATSVALRAAVGHRYHDHNSFRQHACWQNEKAGDKNSSNQQNDSTTRR